MENRVDPTKPHNPDDREVRDKRIKVMVSLTGPRLTIALTGAREGNSRGIL
jgi:hypothetical protein